MATNTAAPIGVLELCAVDFTVRQFISPFAHYLQEHGCRVWCGCSKGPYWEELQARGFSMVDIPISRRMSVPRNLLAFIKLVVWLGKNRPDVVHVHTPIAAIVGRLAARFAGVPVVIYTAHGFYFHDHMPAGKRRMHQFIEWVMGPMTTHLFCVSEEDVRSATALGIAPVDEVTCVGNGVDSKRFNPERPDVREGAARLREELHIPKDAIVVTIMGRLVREKGYVEFLEAADLLAAKHPNIHFFLAGDTVTDEHDDARAEILRRAASPVFEGRMHMLGMRDDTPEVLAATDIFVLPSHREGLSLSIIEAMMMEKPVIASRIRGCRESVVDGQTGFLVEPGVVSEIADAVDYLVRNPAVGPALGHAGRRRALARYEIGAVLRRQYQVLRHLVAASV